MFMKKHNVFLGTVSIYNMYKKTLLTAHTNLWVQKRYAKMCWLYALVIFTKCLFVSTFFYPLMYKMLDE